MHIPFVLRVQLRQLNHLPAILATSVLLGACAQLTPTDGEPDAWADKIPAKLQVELGARVDKNVLVMLAEPAADSGDDRVSGAGQALSSDTDSLSGSEARELADELVAERAQLYETLQERVLEAIDGRSDAEVLFLYENVPFLFMRLGTLEVAERIAALPEVAGIYENPQFERQLAASLPMINQPAMEASGKIGSGVSVAVLDTGADYTRAAFGSCSAPGGTCKIRHAQDFAAQDGSPDDHGHGTNVSAIVLGVAPGAKVLALDVFNGPTAPGNAILAAIDWSISNRNNYNIVAMNMSLGSGGSASPCSNDFFATAISNARNAGILSAIASGNSAQTAMISSPACVPAAISVGAVYDANVGGVSYSGCSDPSTAADKVTCFSNSASFLTVLAPGAPISAGGITMSGTSQATPHVAGALAVIRAAYPNESLTETVARLTNTGPQITDSRNGISKRRLDLQAAVAFGGADVTPPTGSVSINAGANATNKGAVTLTISASDASGVPSMCVSNTTSCTAFTTFNGTRSWTLATGDGTKTVYVSLKDAKGNVAKVSDTIVRDAKAPTNPTLSANAGNAQVSLSWTTATDAISGMAGYKLVYNTGTATPTSCNAGTVAYSGTSTSTTFAATNGTQYNFRVCALDAAGNLSTGTTATGRPAPERNAPTGSVVIQGGATYSKTPSVTLTIAAADDSAVTSMCIANVSTKCTAFVPFNPTKTWSLSSTGSVFVWFRDVWGNTTTAPVSDSIILDKTAPLMSTFTATLSAGQVSLSWGTATDTGSGLASYKLVWARSTSAPSCTAGAVAYAGTGNSYTHTGRVSGKHSYRLCAIDVAGNVSAGVTRTVTVP